MKIIMPTFEEIKWMPPTITLINTLVKLGYDVNYITIYPDEFYENFDKNHVTNTSLCKKRYSLLKYCENVRLLSSVAYRFDVLLKKLFAHRLKRYVNKIIKPYDILWVVNELTVMYAGCGFLKNFHNKYIFTIYELHWRTFFERNIIKASQNADIVVVPEYNRAHIQKSVYQLKDLPVILPNKPDNHPEKRFLDIKNREIMDKISDIKKSGKKIVLYMGIIGEERPLDKIIEAIKTVKNEFELVIIGRPSLYLNKLKEKYPDGFSYLGYFVPPQHLSVASHADIGLLIYVGDDKKLGLNALYCAPNKIYEYTGFSMPIIANDIPGLHGIIENSSCGECVDFNNLESIVAGLKNCIKNYDIYSENAKKYYNSIDISAIIEKIILNHTKNKDDICKNEFL